MLHNLLPVEHKKKLKQEYLLRSVTVWSLLMSGAFLVGFVALVPSYVNTVWELEAVEQEYQEKLALAQNAENQEATIMETTEMIQVFLHEHQQEKITFILSEILRVKPEGIYITGFSYNRGNRNVLLEAVSAKRDLVAPYARALEENEIFTTVPIPIADLAKNTDLSFRLVIGLDETVL
jgi:hypothetical protein